MYHHYRLILVWKLSILLASSNASVWSQSVPGGVITDVVSFGDSLSDNGNTYHLTFDLYPQPPYYNGRFSNGPVWVEYLAGYLNSSLHDFAYAGSCACSVDGTRCSLESFLPDLSRQFDLYQNDQTRQLSPNSTLFTVLSGGNDIEYAASFGQTVDPGKITSGVIGLVNNLISTGARYILVSNLPPINLTPLGKSNPSGIDNTTASLYDTDLSAALSAIISTNPSVTIIQNNAEALFTFAVSPAGAAQFGLNNTTDACLDAAGNVCASPDGYLFWDSIHPTTRVHDIIAQYARNALFGSGA